MPAAEMQSFRATTPDLLRGERGWMSQIKTAAPGGGRKMFLTSPFIDQAFALTIPFPVGSPCRREGRDDNSCSASVGPATRDCVPLDLWKIGSVQVKTFSVVTFCFPTMHEGFHCVLQVGFVRVGDTIKRVHAVPV